MIRWPGPVVWKTALAWVLLHGGGLAVGEEPTSETVPEVPYPERAASIYVAPVYPPSVDTLAYTAPVRAYRRGSVPAFGVYVGPRAAYAGTLAPWGSISARFYAASYPLPLYAGAYTPTSPPPYGHATTPYRSAPEAPVPQPASVEPSPPPPEPFFSEQSVAPRAVPESIPAPQPFDMPSPDDRFHSQPASEGPRASQPVPRPPVPKPTPASSSSETGPREF
jgi:hypothetical protein